MSCHHRQNRDDRHGHGLLLQHTVLLILVSLSTAFASDGHVPPESSCHKPESCARPCDSQWIVSTRHLCCPQQCPLEEVDLRVEQCVGQADWQPANLSSLASATQNSRTVIYVPGNRTSWDVAIQEGQVIYESLLCHSAQPITFIVWSWPSDRIKRPIVDLRTKARRTNCEGPYLAWLLARLDEHSRRPEAKVSLIGYSYGSRVILGALHVWNGGELAGVRLADCHVTSDTRVRGVFLAPAEHSHWLMPGGTHGRAYDRFDHALSLYNSCDEALKRYRVVDKYERPHALGYSGLAGRRQFVDGAERFHEYDVCHHVGKSHDFQNYLNDDVLVEKIARYALWGVAHPF